MSRTILVTAHGYAGDAHQIRMLLGVMEHHGYPLYILSPEDSKITQMGPHSCLFAGERAYVGQKSWDRQHAQLALILKHSDAEWFFLNDADSFCFTPPFPEYLFEDKSVVYGNKVDDFRKPGETWTDANGSVTWPLDYHAGFELCALQPPYMLSREAMEKIVALAGNMVACAITPFIDFWWLPACKLAGLQTRPFRTGVSCETETDMGLRLVGDKVREGATFVHAVKRQHAFNVLADIYRSTLK